MAESRLLQHEIPYATTPEAEARLFKCLRELEALVSTGQAKGLTSLTFSTNNSYSVIAIISIEEETRPEILKAIKAVSELLQVKL